MATDSVRGQLHVIEDDLELWLPYVGCITLGQMAMTLRNHARFNEWLRERDESGATTP